MVETEKSQTGLGTFIGVFTPTILTILGVILYLRVGWVVGTAGLAGTLVIVVLAHLITLVTTLSLSALATNINVGVGGAYFLISRSLGLEVGGAIGIPLYLSQTLSLTLYSFGLAESLRLFWPQIPVPQVAAGVVVFVTLVAGRSTELALRMQLPVLVFIVLSLLSLVMGIDWSSATPVATVPVRGEGEGFWLVFAVFFPAVTGILAGVSLSGDLKDPGRSIPRGSLIAVVVGFVVYMIVPVILVFAADSESLRRNSLIWTEIAVLPYVVMAGLWGAVLSSAIGSILAAPRTLQALAMDQLVPDFLAKTRGNNNEPLVALLLSGAVALAAVALGDLNTVATVVTMFFLTTYGMLNLVAGLEELVGDLSYRPRIRIPWYISFAGAFGCFGAMFLISPVMGLGAMAAEFILWAWLQRKSMRASFGDLRSGFWFRVVRFALERLKEVPYEPRNWRPHILVFARNLAHNVPVVRLAAHFSQDQGIITVVTLLLGDVEEHEHAAEALKANQDSLAEQGIGAFCEVVAVPSLDNGMVTVMQANGFGGLEANTAMFGWPGEGSQALGRTLGVIRRLKHLDKSSIIVRPRARSGDKKRRQRPLVVWWRGRESNGDLMLLLAHLLSLSESMRGCRIQIKSVVEPGGDDAAELKKAIEGIVEEVRIPADVQVIEIDENHSALEVIQENSQEARVVFLGMGVAEPGLERDYALRLQELVKGLPTTLLVLNSGPFKGRLV